LAAGHCGCGATEERPLQCFGYRRHCQAWQWTADDLAPLVNHTLDVFGPDRVMFGGDWPSAPWPQHTGSACMLY
jgi:predicted TIM-barrel fold metal-dependent hydrolase